MNKILQPSISEIWNHLSWVMIQRLWYLPRRSREAHKPQIRWFFFKARLQLQKWSELSRTNVLKQIYYEVRYGSVEMLQWISAYSNLLQVNYCEVWDSRLLTASFVIWPSLLDVRWPQRRYIQLSKRTNSMIRYEWTYLAI